MKQQHAKARVLYGAGHDLRALQTRRNGSFPSPLRHWMLEGPPRAALPGTHSSSDDDPRGIPINDPAHPGSVDDLAVSHSLHLRSHLVAVETASGSSAFSKGAATAQGISKTCPGLAISANQLLQCVEHRDWHTDAAIDVARRALAVCLIQQANQHQLHDGSSSPSWSTQSYQMSAAVAGKVAAAAAVQQNLHESSSWQSAADAVGDQGPRLLLHEDLAQTEIATLALAAVFSSAAGSGSSSVDNSNSSSESSTGSITGTAALVDDTGSGDTAASMPGDATYSSSCRGSSFSDHHSPGTQQQQQEQQEQLCKGQVLEDHIASSTIGSMKPDTSREHAAGETRATSAVAAAVAAATEGTTDITKCAPTAAPAAAVPSAAAAAVEAADEPLVGPAKIATEAEAAEVEAATSRETAAAAAAAAHGAAVESAPGANAAVHMEAVEAASAEARSAAEAATAAAAVAQTNAAKPAAAAAAEAAAAAAKAGEPALFCALAANAADPEAAAQREAATTAAAAVQSEPETTAIVVQVETDLNATTQSSVSDQDAATVGAAAAGGGGAVSSSPAATAAAEAQTTMSNNPSTFETQQHQLQQPIQQQQQQQQQLKQSNSRPTYANLLKAVKSMTWHSSDEVLNVAKKTLAVGLVMCANRNVMLSEPVNSNPDCYQMLAARAGQLMQSAVQHHCGEQARKWESIPKALADDERFKTMITKPSELTVLFASVDELLAAGCRIAAAAEAADSGQQQQPQQQQQEVVTVSQLLHFAESRDWCKNNIQLGTCRRVLAIEIIGLANANTPDDQPAVTDPECYCLRGVAAGPILTDHYQQRYGGARPWKLTQVVDTAYLPAHMVTDCAMQVIVDVQAMLRDICNQQQQQQQQRQQQQQQQKKISQTIGLPHSVDLNHQATSASAAAAAAVTVEQLLQFIESRVWHKSNKQLDLVRRVLATEIVKVANQGFTTESAAVMSPEAYHMYGGEAGVFMKRAFEKHFVGPKPWQHVQEVLEASRYFRSWRPEPCSLMVALNIDLVVRDMRKVHSGRNVNLFPSSAAAAADNGVASLQKQQQASNRSITSSSSRLTKPFTVLQLLLHISSSSWDESSLDLDAALRWAALDLAFKANSGLELHDLACAQPDEHSDHLSALGGCIAALVPRKDLQLQELFTTDPWFRLIGPSSCNELHSMQLALDVDRVMSTAAAAAAGGGEGGDAFSIQQQQQQQPTWHQVLTIKGLLHYVVSKPWCKHNTSYDNARRAAAAFTVLKANVGRHINQRPRGDPEKYEISTSIAGVVMQRAIGCKSRVSITDVIQQNRLLCVPESNGDIMRLRYFELFRAAVNAGSTGTPQPASSPAAVAASSHNVSGRREPWPTQDAADWQQQPQQPQQQPGISRSGTTTATSGGSSSSSGTFPRSSTQISVQDLLLHIISREWHPSDAAAAAAMRSAALLLAFSANAARRLNEAASAVVGDYLRSEKEVGSAITSISGVPYPTRLDVVSSHPLFTLSTTQTSSRNQLLQLDVTSLLAEAAAAAQNGDLGVNKAHHQPQNQDRVVTRPTVSLWQLLQYVITRTWCNNNMSYDKGRRAVAVLMVLKANAGQGLSGRALSATDLYEWTASFAGGVMKWAAGDRAWRSARSVFASDQFLYMPDPSSECIRLDVLGMFQAAQAAGYVQMPRSGASAIGVSAAAAAAAPAAAAVRVSAHSQYLTRAQRAQTEDNAAMQQQQGSMPLCPELQLLGTVTAADCAAAQICIVTEQQQQQSDALQSMLQHIQAAKLVAMDLEFGAGSNSSSSTSGGALAAFMGSDDEEDLLNGTAAGSSSSSSRELGRYSSSIPGGPVVLPWEQNLHQQKVITGGCQIALMQLLVPAAAAAAAAAGDGDSGVDTGSSSSSSSVSVTKEGNSPEDEEAGDNSGNGAVSSSSNIGVDSSSSSSNVSTSRSNSSSSISAEAASSNLSSSSSSSGISWDTTIYLIEIPRRSSSAQQLMAQLTALLESTDVIKVLHDARQDSCVLQRQFGVSLRNVLDLQLLAGICNLGAAGSSSSGDRFEDRTTRALSRVSVIELHEAYGYPHPVKEVLKSSSRLWFKRPLPNIAIQYAADDVRYLLPLAHEILQQIPKALISLSDLQLMLAQYGAAALQLNQLLLPGYSSLLLPESATQHDSSIHSGRFRHEQIGLQGLVVGGDLEGAVRQAWELQLKYVTNSVSNRVSASVDVSNSVSNSDSDGTGDSAAKYVGDGYFQARYAVWLNEEHSSGEAGAAAAAAIGYHDGGGDDDDGDDDHDEAADSLQQLFPESVYSHLQPYLTHRHPGQPYITQILADAGSTVQLQLSDHTVVELPCSLEIPEALQHLQAAAAARGGYGLQQQQRPKAQADQSPAAAAAAAAAESSRISADSTILQQPLAHILGAAYSASSSSGSSSSSFDGRLRIPGTLHHVSTLRDLEASTFGLTYFIGRHIRGSAMTLADVLSNMKAAARAKSLAGLSTAAGGGGTAAHPAKPQSLFILGRPGCGKTTLLRTLAKLMSSSAAAGGLGMSLVCIDRRNALAIGPGRHVGLGGARVVPVGADVCQGQLMFDVLRAHRPQAVVVDELTGTLEEITAAAALANDGVILIAGLSSNSLAELSSKPHLVELLSATSAGDLVGAGNIASVLAELQDFDRLRLHLDAQASLEALSKAGSSSSSWGQQLPVSNTQLRVRDPSTGRVLVQFETPDAAQHALAAAAAAVQAMKETGGGMSALGHGSSGKTEQRSPSVDNPQEYRNAFAGGWMVDLLHAAVHKSIAAAEAAA